jgi:short-subunit dehydrogenase involved in D-alanine esterification of teichoic acids
VLLNNAGIQKKVAQLPLMRICTILPCRLPLIILFAQIKVADTFDMEEMTINFEAPVHLCHLAIPHLKGKANATM